MKPFRWNHDKNDELKAERGVSFEEVVLAIEAGGLLDVYDTLTPENIRTNSCSLSL